MERGAWTGERLDDRFEHIDRRFDQMDRRFDRLENEMRDGFASLRSEFRTELRSEVGGLRAEFNSLRNMMFRSYVALAVALIASVVARGF